jgi:hypothetical protein
MPLRRAFMEDLVLDDARFAERLRVVVHAVAHLHCVRDCA